MCTIVTQFLLFILDCYKCKVFTITAKITTKIVTEKYIENDRKEPKLYITKKSIKYKNKRVIEELRKRN